MTIHSSAAFAERRLEDEPDEWVPDLLASAAGHHDGEVIAHRSHRWRFSEPRLTSQVGAAVVDATVPVLIAGESFAGARVEGAFTSGVIAGERMAELLG